MKEINKKEGTNRTCRLDSPLAEQKSVKFALEAFEAILADLRQVERLFGVVSPYSLLSAFPRDSHFV